MLNRLAYDTMDLPSWSQLSLPSATTSLISGVLVIYGLYFILDHVLDVAVLPPTDLLWNAIVTLVPSLLILDSSQRQQLNESASRPEKFAAKSEALRKMLGFGSRSALLQKLPAAGEAVGLSVSNIIHRQKFATSTASISETPSGLGNWDNSCYQNSVLQALSSLSSLRTWLDSSRVRTAHAGDSNTTSALRELVMDLLDSRNNGKYLWTPAKLKSMSSWQQQDAQEYFSKIMDELDKDAKKASLRAFVKRGLETVAQESQADSSAHEQNGALAFSHNPLEGWIAQRVACTRCGSSEGYSMIPFNCLTVPLGPAFAYSLGDCLNEYTRREDIEGVECRRCTLLQSQANLNKIIARVPASQQDNSAEVEAASCAMALPTEVRNQVVQRLQMIDAALERDDYSDKTLKGDCQIPSKAFVSSTKSREALIGRAPPALVIHVNRSVFNEMTGMQSKNYAHVRYPQVFDLRPWMLSPGGVPVGYRLSAVVTHKGAHENGHYICYRRHPRLDRPQPRDGGDLKEDYEKWYQISDADVYDATEAEVLNPSAGGVFMLFYERIENVASVTSAPTEQLAPAAVTNISPEGEVVPPIQRDVESADIVAAGNDDLDDDKVAIDDFRASTVAPSDVSECDTDLTDYNGLDADAEKEKGEFRISAQVAHPILRTAAPQEMIRQDHMHNHLSVTPV